MFDASSCPAPKLRKELATNWEEYLPVLLSPVSKAAENAYMEVLEGSVDEFIQKLGKRRFCTIPLWCLHVLRHFENEGIVGVDSQATIESITYKFQEEICATRRDMYPRWLDGHCSIHDYEEALSNWFNESKGLKHTIFNKYWPEGESEPRSGRPFKQFCKTAIALFTLRLAQERYREQNRHYSIFDKYTCNRASAHFEQSEKARLPSATLDLILNARWNYPSAYIDHKGVSHDIRWERELIQDESHPLGDYFAAVCSKFRYIDAQYPEIDSHIHGLVDDEAMQRVEKLIGDYYTLTLKEAALAKRRKELKIIGKKKTYANGVVAYVKSKMGKVGVAAYIAHCQAASQLFTSMNQSDAREMLRSQDDYIVAFKHILYLKSLAMEEEEFRNDKGKNIIEILTANDKTHSSTILAAFLINKEMARMHQWELKFFSQILSRLWPLILKELPANRLTLWGKMVLRYNGGAVNLDTICDEFQIAYPDLIKFFNNRLKDYPFQWNTLIKY